MSRLKLVDPTGKFVVPVVVDTREQQNFTFEGLRCDAADGGGPLLVETIRGTLKSGDYSLRGYEELVAIERKSIDDLFGTLGQGRDRFERELARLAELKFAAVVIEADWRAILDIYSPEIIQLRQAFAGKIAARDATQPWAKWLAMLEAVTPGPPERSRLNLKTVWRSVTAWRVRYRTVHWEPCFSRQFAEITTFRLLERFLKEEARRARQSDDPPTDARVRDG